MAAATLLDTLSDSIRATHSWFEATLADVTTEQAHFRPPGVANPICAVYAHTVVGSDFTLNVILRKAPPLVFTWQDRAGLSELSSSPDWHDWATSLRLDINAFGPYARAVYDAWSDYLRSLRADQLDCIVEMPRMGSRTVAQMLTMQVQHYSAHCGEIACLKGLTGSVGYRSGTPDGIG